jgi:hypothetical protein
MSDITMCQDKDCPKKNNCYRFTAQPDEYLQSYFAASPRNEDGTCKYYWPLTFIPKCRVKIDEKKNYEKEI